MTGAYAVSGQYPAGQVAVALPAGPKLWFGSVQVNGPTSYGTAQSNIEWVIFASQPRLQSGAGVGASGGIPYVGVPARIRWATVTGGVYQTGSAIITATIASGGLPDLTASGRYNLSGVVAVGALQGPAVCIQWLALASGFNSINNQPGLTVNGTSGIVNAVVSGQDIGLLLVGD